MTVILETKTGALVSSAVEDAVLIFFPLTPAAVS